MVGIPYGDIYLLAPCSLLVCKLNDFNHNQRVTPLPRWTASP